MTEFSRAALEQLREPLETGVINISRASQRVQYPAKFKLVAACNPCKCGYFGDGTDRCQCSAASVESYRSKLSGPLLDRIDMHVYLHRLSPKELQATDANAETSAQVRKQVQKCFKRQLDRQGYSNNDLQGADLETHCRLGKETLQFFELAAEKLQLSARAYHRILRLARTIADLDEAEQIAQHHLAEAIGYRKLV